MPEVHEPVLGCGPAGRHHLNGTLCAAAGVHVYAYGTAAQDAVGGVRTSRPDRPLPMRSDTHMPCRLMISVSPLSWTRWSPWRRAPTYRPVPSSRRFAFLDRVLGSDLARNGPSAFTPPGPPFRIVTRESARSEFNGTTAGRDGPDEPDGPGGESGPSAGPVPLVRVRKWGRAGRKCRARSVDLPLAEGRHDRVLPCR